MFWLKSNVLKLRQMMVKFVIQLQEMLSQRIAMIASESAISKKNMTHSVVHLSKQSKRQPLGLIMVSALLYSVSMELVNRLLLRV